MRHQINKMYFTYFLMLSMNEDHNYMSSLEICMLSSTVSKRNGVYQELADGMDDDMIYQAYLTYTCVPLQIHVPSILRH